jgi:P-type Cu+ transporter
MMSAKTANTNPSVTELAVSGLTCNNCARKVTGIIQEFKTVACVAVELDQQRATIRWKPGAKGDLPAVLDALDRAGYSPRVIEGGAEQASMMMGGWALNLAVGIPVTVILMLGEWVLRPGEARWFAWTAFGSAAVVQMVAGARFYRGAWAQLKAGSSNMDTLVSLGSTTAFGYSTWALFAGWPGHLYFMEAAAIITLISLGHWVEARVGAKAAGSLKALMTLAPQTARRLTAASAPDEARPRNPELLSQFQFSATPAAAQTEIEVPISQLRIGDRVVLRPGDRVPVDGEVAEGESAVDESMLTGESAPVDKAAKCQLYAGTTNMDGRLVMRVTATGEATALAHIITAVQRAQSSRANIQRLGDKVSNVFVPIVCTLALGTALWWGLGYESAKSVHVFIGQWLWPSHLAETALAAAFIGAAAVLIIACPCAMGLATPAAIMAAANTAARRGILIRDGVALEKAGAVTAVLFDKTGTLTIGKPTVAKVWSNGTPNEDALTGLAATLAKDSTHPISQAIASVPSRDPAERGQSSGAQTAASCRNATTAPYEWREVRGAGIEAKVKTEAGDVKTARLGSQRWLRECGVDSAAGEAFVREWSAQGATIVGLASESELLGLFAVQDALKPGAVEVVRQLHQSGLKTFLVTGDNSLTAEGIARHAGIPSENVFAEVRPEQKADFVKRLQSRGEKVAFVGDGINDAPALEQADLGIAVSRASDIAREAADIILLKSDIEAVPESLGLARAALRTIKQNLFWAFFYNAAAVPLAVLGFMSPVLCAAAMGVSDLVLIGNSLRLRNWRQPHSRREEAS